MESHLEELGCLVPVSRRKQEAAHEAQLPGRENPDRPPRVNLDRAYQLIRHTTKWGELGADFLKAVFFDADGQSRKVVLEDVVQYCARKEQMDSVWGLRSAVVRFLEALEESGLVVSFKNPAMHTQYALNPTPGVTELLQVERVVGFQILSTIEKGFDQEKAAEFVAERIGAPFKTGTTCADLASRLAQRTFLSTLMKDSSLYVEGNHQGSPLRAQLSFYLNEGINAGVIKFERILKDGEEWEVFSLTPLGSRFGGWEGEVKPLSADPR